MVIEFLLKSVYLEVNYILNLICISLIDGELFLNYGSYFEQKLTNGIFFH